LASRRHNNAFYPLEASSNKSKLFLQQIEPDHLKEEDVPRRQLQRARLLVWSVRSRAWRPGGGGATSISAGLSQPISVAIDSDSVSSNSVAALGAAQNDAAAASDAAKDVAVDRAWPCLGR